MTQLDMNGNVQTIFYPEESDKSLIGLNKAESSYLRAFFAEQKLDKMIMWPKVNGSLTPIPKLTTDQLTLSSFKWYDDLRPKNKEDIFRNVKMKEEDIVRPVRIFTQEELEGASGPEPVQDARKERPVRKVKPSVAKSDSLIHTLDSIATDSLSVPSIEFPQSLSPDSLAVDGENPSPLKDVSEGEIELTPTE